MDSFEDKLKGSQESQEWLNSNEVSRYSTNFPTNPDHFIIYRDPTPLLEDNHKHILPRVDQSDTGMSLHSPIPSQRAESPGHRPNFSNPLSCSTTFGDMAGLPSLFGPRILNLRTEIKEENLDYCYTTDSPYREPGQCSENGSKNNSFVEYSQVTSCLSNTCSNQDAAPSSEYEQLSIQQAARTTDNIDDDIVIIDPMKASMTAKRRWREPRGSIIIHGDVPIKVEQNFHLPVNVSSRPPVRQSSDLAKIIAAQRAVLRKAQLAPRTGNVAPSSSRLVGSSSSIDVESASRSKKRRHDGQMEQIDAAMGIGCEDDSWMHEEAEEEDEEFTSLKTKYEFLSRKLENGEISGVERVELYRVQRQLASKGRVLEAAMSTRRHTPSDDGENSLFIPDETRAETVHRHRVDLLQRRSKSPDNFDDNFDLELSGESAAERDGSTDNAFSRMMQQELIGGGLERVPTEKELAKATNPRRPRKKVPKDAREVVTREEETRREKQRAKAQKQKTRQTANNGAGKKKVAASKAKTTAKRKGAKRAMGPPESLLRMPGFERNSGQDEIGQMILDDLMNNDPIRDRLTNPIFDTPAEPAILGSNDKATQLQRLFANIPAGSSTSTAKSDKVKLQQASKSFGYAKVKAVDGKWMVKGMKSPLYHHQLLGAQWMVRRELSSEPPFGGILADGMGLGKTVQTIACMVANRPKDVDRLKKIKATLIVVPSSLINQWIMEIRKHAQKEVFPKVMHYRKRSKIPIEVLEDLDIVVTSYHEVMKQFPFPDVKTRVAMVPGGGGYKQWWKIAAKTMGDLHKISWYRVVLDEAHYIKNNGARTSLACQNLRSLYRWCLTGTPLLNRLEELFPYMRFLQTDYAIDWKTFQRYFCDPDAPDNNTRLAILLSYTMMRRTMKTTILNRPIIVLPPPHPDIQWIDFSPEEKIIYRITENRFRANLNAYLAKGEADSKYASFLILLLRLRQCTSHPFMLESTMREMWTKSDVEELRSRLDKLERVKLPFYEQCKVWVSQSEEERHAANAARDRGEDIPDTEEPMPFGQSDYGYSFNIGKALDTLNEDDLHSRVACNLCSDHPRNAHKTDCGHIFCKECLLSYMHRKAALEDPLDYLICPACDRIFSTFTRCHDIPYRDDDDAEDTHDHMPNHVPGKKRQRNSHEEDAYDAGTKGKDALRFEPTTKLSTWVSKSDTDENFQLVPSAKTAALKSILLKGFSEGPFDKVVIYVQFQLLARIVARICKKEGWGFLYLSGESSIEHRSKAIDMFRDDPDIKILISGLKCGGIGLNFPFANRCISLDLWWNHAVEQQAFGRIFRIGQKKETFMTRIVVRNTIDVRLLSMQFKKLKDCDRAVSDRGKGNQNLSLQDLAQLFGFLRMDGDKIISIEPDYDDDEPDGCDRME